MKHSRYSESKASRGKLVANLLAGAWRIPPPAPSVSARELEEAATLLLRSGAGGLTWCKIRHSDLRSSPVASQFQQVYRLQTLQAELRQRSLKRIVPLLRSYGVEPLLVKGWAIARLYPEPGFRPYCDLDICVSPDAYEAAKEVLASPEGEGCDVDLHLGFDKFNDRQTENVLERSELVKLDDVEVRVLEAEDHLRFLCMHLLRHGAVRPLWLCDIGVLLESRKKDFDWDRCLSGSRREVDWVACAIGLASELVEVDVDEMPVARRARNLPTWLVPAVLRDWGVPRWSPRQVEVLLRQPANLLRELPLELRRHWPNPIEATMSLRGPFNNLPRLPFQVGHVVSRTTALLSQLFAGSRSAIHHGI